MYPCHTVPRSCKAAKKPLFPLRQRIHSSRPHRTGARQNPSLPLPFSSVRKSAGSACGKYHTPTFIKMQDNLQPSSIFRKKVRVRKNSAPESHVLADIRPSAAAAVVAAAAVAVLAGAVVAAAAAQDDDQQDDPQAAVAAKAVIAKAHCCFTSLTPPGFSRRSGIVYGSPLSQVPWQRKFSCGRAPFPTQPLDRPKDRSRRSRSQGPVHPADLI